MSPVSRLRLGKRKTISPVISTVLIIAVTLIASVAIGGFVFGIFAQGQNSAQVAVTGTALLATYFTSGGTTTTRSEERRVGKEYRTRYKTYSCSDSVANHSFTRPRSNHA